mmetsp:Transcript_93200/g.199962  ORF Transcript_93200/g.199962 Transcript_93200/m.199962 type:complete len:205 (+) Transcript_93200:920-1534(+)
MEPSKERARECCAPAATCRSGMPRTAPASTMVGRGIDALLPKPRAPREPSPKAKREPATERTRVWSSPQATCLTCTRGGGKATTRGCTRARDVLPCPSWPNSLLCPQERTRSPPSRMVTMCSRPPAAASTWPPSNSSKSTRSMPREPSRPSSNSQWLLFWPAAQSAPFCVMRSTCSQAAPKPCKDLPPKFSGTGAMTCCASPKA